MEKNIKSYKWKKWVKFRHIYGAFLFIVTALLVWHVVHLLVLTPLRETGESVHGSRLENIPPLEEHWKTEAIEFGATLEEIEYVTIHWLNGPVVYVNVRVEPGTTRRYARRAARAVVEHFIEVSDGVASQYNIQVVASYGDILEMRNEHHAAVEQHVHEYNHSLVEDILEWAERWPSETNVNRAASNIEIFATSILAAVGEDGLEEMRGRLTALGGGQFEEFEEEDFEPMPNFPADTRQIPRSEISRFPTWGAWNNERERVVWSP